MPKSEHEWLSLECVEPYEEIIDPWLPMKAEAEFLRTYEAVRHLPT